jgi:hypothetical protein
MALLVKKTFLTVFMVGLLITAILALVGMIYLSQMAFSDKKQTDGQYFGDTTETQRNIARLAMVVLWIQTAWILIGTFIEKVWTE